jgi:hypothetical protein
MLADEGSGIPQAIAAGHLAGQGACGILVSIRIGRAAIHFPEVSCYAPIR